MAVSPYAQGRQYGLKPSTDLSIHQLYGIEPPEIIQALPPIVSLQDRFPQCYDQLTFNSCTANAINGAIHFYLGQEQAVPSRMYLYYYERLSQGIQNQDDGSTISAGIQIAQQQGVPSESIWQYDIGNLYLIPNNYANVIAKHTKISGVQVITTFNDLKHALFQGYPVVIGMMVFSSFESQSVAQTGVLTLPQPTEQQLGGHAVVVVGYNDTTQMVTIRNSWGTGWGQDGYFLMPYAYIQNPNWSFDWFAIQSIIT